MFSSTHLFQNTPCPLGKDCRVPYCIFAHQLLENHLSSIKQESLPRIGNEEHGAFIQKRSVEIDDKDHAGSNGRKLPRTAVLSQSTVKASHEKKSVTSLARTVSPPVPKPSKPARLTPTPETSGLTIPLPPKPSKAEALMPRVMAHPPVQYPVRLQLLKLVHDQFVRLNKELAASSDAEKEPLKMTPQEAITEALNEEETVAKESPKVYANLLKLRIVALRKMTLKEWKKLRLEQIAKSQPEAVKPTKKAKKRFESGLSAEDEFALLPKVVTPIGELVEHGYVPKPPSDKDVQEAEAGVKLAAGWESCDRCESRFQVFPGRREDGVLTTNGPCVYHWGRKRRPPRQPGDGGSRDDLWTCCRGEMGSKGCTKVQTHVFKVADPKRLAHIMQFEETKTPCNAPLKEAVAFDCEMGYTSLGMELIRLTATAWPSGDELVDVLVRPLGEILDLNSRFSGVWPNDMANAVPYGSDLAAANENDASRKRRKTENGDAASNQLQIVDSPLKARELLQKHLTLDTPLIGHAIENDLNATRICHPIIIDTVLLFPHPSGLPYRYGLKALSKNHLEIDIQTGGEAGHDSKEDARATGELVRFRVAQAWKDMQRQGWKIDNGIFIPPKPRTYGSV